MNFRLASASRSSAAAVFAIGCLLGAAGPASAKVFYSKSEAIELAFPGADRIEKRTHVIDDAQAGRIEAMSRGRLESRLVSVWTGYQEDQVVGHAFIDIHTVRTLPEAFLVVLTPEGKVRSLRVLAFYEPQEYMPPEGWLTQFGGRNDREAMRVHAGIHGIAGSTLSARAVTSGVRRSLALFEVLVASDS